MRFIVADLLGILEASLVELTLVFKILRFLVYVSMAGIAGTAVTS